MSQTVLNLDGRAGQPLAEFPIENSVSLERLLTHKFPIDWFEAVAILLFACEQPEPRSLSFDPEHVVVRSDGSVQTTAGAGRSPAVEQSIAVQNAATLLRAVLPETFPTPLRLVLTQALSTPSSYPSIGEFAQALEYFERPDRTSVVRSVFDRWRARQEQLRIVAGAAAAKPESFDETPPARHAETSASRRRAVIWTIASAATMAAVLTVWIAFASQGMRGSGIALHKAAASTLGAAASRVGSLIGRFRSTASNPDRPDVAAAAPAIAAADVSTPAAAPASLQKPSPRARPAPAVARTFSSRPLFDPFGALKPPPRIIPQPELNLFLESQAPVIIEDSPTAPHGFVDAPGPLSRIYSVIDADVAPPTAVYPHLPASAFVARDDALAFDMVIDEAGRVESVKSRPASNTVRNTLRLAMSLSAAKSWRFQPAMKDGRHVKFRHTIWLPIP